MKNRTRSTVAAGRNVVSGLSRLEKLIPLSGDKHTPINVVLVYEDDETREWARDAYERVCRASGVQQVRPTWWRVNNLSEPSILAAAASTAMRADVVVVAVRTSEGLPLPFYAWTSSWAPNRFQFSGVLVSIVGSALTASAPGRLSDYLGAIAKQARMEFLCEARTLRPEVPGSSSALSHTIAQTNGRRGNPLRAAVLAKS
jgi:hypothetical protein